MCFCSMNNSEVHLRVQNILWHVSMSRGTIAFRNEISQFSSVPQDAT